MINKYFLWLTVLTLLTACGEIAVDSQDIQESDIQTQEVSQNSVNNIFEFNTLEIGDQYGEFTVENIDRVTDAHELSEWNLKVDFSGEVELTGDYEYIEDDGAFFSDIACFIVEGESLAKIPLHQGVAGAEGTRFCFENNDFAKDQLGLENRYNVTIVVDSYTANVLRGEVVDMARLKEVR